MPGTSFDKHMNTDVKIAPFRSVLYGRHMALLETDLNEMQELLYNNVKTMAATYLGNSLSGEVVVENGKISLSGYALVEGYNICIDGIQLDAVQGAEYWFNIRECIVDKDSNIRKHGYVDGEVIENTILDKRWGIETAKRKSIEFSITNEHDEDSDASVMMFKLSVDAQSVDLQVSSGIGAVFKGATPSEDGAEGTVPKPLTGEQGKVLKADGTWGYPTTITTVDGTKMKFAIEDGHVKVIYDE